MLIVIPVCFLVCYYVVLMQSSFLSDTTKCALSRSNNDACTGKLISSQVRLAGQVPNCPTDEWSFLAHTFSCSSNASDLEAFAVIAGSLESAN